MSKAFVPWYKKPWYITLAQILLVPIKSCGSLFGQEKSENVSVNSNGHPGSSADLGDGNKNGSNNIPT